MLNVIELIVIAIKFVVVEYWIIFDYLVIVDCRVVLILIIFCVLFFFLWLIESCECGVYVNVFGGLFFNFFYVFYRFVDSVEFGEY